jgi:hypothetical protein
MDHRVAQLDSLRALAGVSLHRWRQFGADCHSFLNSSEGWAERAAERGWTIDALFGCAAKRPLDHLRDAGLLWFINGGRLTALHTDWAVIAANGAERVFHKRPNTANMILPWRLR